MSEPLRQHLSPLSSTPMSSSSSSSSSYSTSRTTTTTTRHRPIKPINTHRANNNKRTHTSSLSASASATASRTPRSPFGARTGSPRTPLAPQLARQAPTQVVALLVLAVALLGVAWWVVMVRRGIGEGEGEMLLQGRHEHGGGGGGAGVLPLWTDTAGVEGQVAKRVVPNFPLTTLAVGDDAEFQDGGEVGHEAWMRMFPRGSGQVRVDEPRKWGLPRSERLVDGQGRYVGEAEVFEVAVVQELECLLVVRDVLMRWEEGEGEGLQEWESRDAKRCLDHLRQAILCHADTTLERIGHSQGPWQSRAYSPNGIPHVDMDGSVGTGRTCKDWEHVRRWLEENRPDRDSDQPDL